MLSYEMTEYKFIKSIGKGSFSKVYKVQRISDG